MKHNWVFRHTCCINNAHWQSSGNLIFLCKHYIVISGTRAGFFLDVLFFLLAAILSGLHEKPKWNKDWDIEKRTWKNFREGYDFLTARPAFFIPFCCFLRLLPPSSQVTYDPYIKIHIIAMGGKLCDDIMIERLKIWKSLAI